MKIPRPFAAPRISTLSLLFSPWKSRQTTSRHRFGFALIPTRGWLSQTFRGGICFVASTQLALTALSYPSPSEAAPPSTVGGPTPPLPMYQSPTPTPTIFPTPKPTSTPVPIWPPLGAISSAASPAAEASVTPELSPDSNSNRESSPSTEAESDQADAKRLHPSGEEQQPLLRAKALELAGAFTNDGYKIRDSFWFSMLPPLGQASLLAVNLFAGNQYWFCVTFAQPAERVILKLYNEEGNLVSTQFYEKDSTAALGAEPSESGKYYLSVELAEGSPANFCALYTYK